MNIYPDWICDDCSDRHGYYAVPVSSYRMPDPDDPDDVCGWCGSKDAPLVDPRDSLVDVVGYVDCKGKVE